MNKLLPFILGLTLLSTTHSFGLALYFWDTNGATPGAGGPTPTGTWGVDAYWSEDDKAGNPGTKATVAWPAGNFAVFCAGDDATGTYTINVSGEVQVADIHVDLGEVTFAPAHSTGDSLKLIDGDGKGDIRLLSAGHKSATCIARYDVPLTSATNVVRYKRGTIIFGATNTFTGTLTVEGGVLQCAAPLCLPLANPLVLANNDTTRGDFNPEWQYTPAVFDSGGLDQQLGTLTLGGTDGGVARVLSLGNGPGTLSFADSSAAAWSGFTLTISNYTLGSSRLRFGTSSSGLTATQLGEMQFADFLNLPGTIDASGYVTPNLPKITQSTPSGGTVHIVWTSVIGRTYRVWSKDTLPGASWNNLGNVYAGDVTAYYDDLTPNPNGRFYRVEVLP